MKNAKSCLLLVASKGKLWAIGGQGYKGNYTSRVEVYDPETDTWSGSAKMKTVVGPVSGGVL